MFDKIRTYCMFLGYPRSGHTLYGCLLDAHRNIVIAQECHVLGLIQKSDNITRQQIYSKIIESSKNHALNGKLWQGYDYSLPGLFQGDCSNDIYVIGDKKGGSSVDALRKNPNLLNLLQERVNVPIKYIHVIRNPFDNISTLTMRHEKGNLENGINHYFRLVDKMIELKTQINNNDMIDIYHEKFIIDSEIYLRKLLSFIGINKPDHCYLDSCQRIIFKDPKTTRDKVTFWNDKNIKIVQNKIDKVDYLSCYSFYSQ